jgi:hypothetical protein
MGKHWGDRYEGPKGRGFQGISEWDPDAGDAMLDEAFEEAAAQVQIAVDRDGEDEELLAAEFDVYITVKARRSNQNVKTYKVIIVTSR